MRKIWCLIVIIHNIYIYVKTKYYYGDKLIAQRNFQYSKKFQNYHIFNQYSNKSNNSPAPSQDAKIQYLQAKRARRLSFYSDLGYLRFIEMSFPIV